MGRVSVVVMRSLLLKAGTAGTGPGVETGEEAREHLELVLGEFLRELAESVDAGTVQLVEPVQACNGQGDQACASVVGIRNRLHEAVGLEPSDAATDRCTGQAEVRCHIAGADRSGATESTEDQPRQVVRAVLRLAQRGRSHVSVPELRDLIVQEGLCSRSPFIHCASIN